MFSIEYKVDDRFYPAHEGLYESESEAQSKIDILKLVHTFDIFRVVKNAVLAESCVK